MANHNLPTLTSTYTNFITELDNRLDDISLQFDPALTTATNLVVGAIRWTGASSKWQKWSGISWTDLSALYAINISGNASTVTNGVYTNGSYADPAWITSLAGSKVTGSINGNAATVTNGVYTNGSYADPTWITSIAGSKVTGSINGNAATVTNGVYTNGSYADPAWITSIAGSKVTGNITGSSTSCTGNSATATSATRISNTGGWTVYTGLGNSLFFTYNGTNIGKLDINGNLTVIGSVTAYGIV